MKRRTLLAFAAAAPATALLAACGANRNNGTTGMGGINGSNGMGSTNGMTGMAVEQGPFDQQFIDMMVPHHQAAVEMAKIAQQRAEHPDLKMLANGIIASQNEEIGQMQGWRKTWYGSDATPPMDQMPMLRGMSATDITAMSHMMDDMKGLQTAMPFDKAFLAAMLPHHQSAVDAAQIALGQTTHPEIRTIAGNIITGQQREIMQMQGWMQAWYGAPTPKA